MSRVPCVLAVIWRAACFAMLASASCSRQEPESARVDADIEIVKLNQRLALLSQRAGPLHPASPADLTGALGLVATASMEVATLRETRDALRREIEVLERQLPSRKKSVLLERRARMRGTAMARLVIRDGRSFDQVTLTGIEDEGVTVRHTHGVATLRTRELTEDQQVCFGLDESFSLEAEARESALVAAYEQAVEAELAAIARNLRADRPDRMDKVRRKLPPRSLPPWRHRPLAMPPRSFGGRSGHSSVLFQQNDW